MIDATKNAFLHNNMGLRYMEEHCYYAAIQEFKIAISLNPNTQATAVYYKNIGDASVFQKSPIQQIDRIITRYKEYGNFVHSNRIQTNKTYN